MKIYITMPHDEVTDTFLTPPVWERLKSLGEVEQNPYDRSMTPEEIVEFAHDADVLLTGWSSYMLTRADVEKMPNLKLIAHTGSTVAFLVAPDVYETGVKVISGNDLFGKSVAEGTLCYILAALRQLEYYMGQMRTGGYRGERGIDNRGFFGKKVGIVGFGAIAKHFVEMTRYFGNEVLIYSSHLTDEEAAKYGARTATLEEIFSQCDVISIHAGRTPKTVGMVSRQLMEMMKPDALLVNTARGQIIDEPAMVELLQQKRFYAAIDVLCVEPADPDHPIRKCENALLMPHMGGPTVDMRALVALDLCDDIERLQKGEPLKNIIVAERLSKMSIG